MPCLSGYVPFSPQGIKVLSPIFIKPSLALRTHTQVIHAQHIHEPLKLRARLFGSVKNACHQRTCRAIALVKKRAADTVRPGQRQSSLVTALAAMAILAVLLLSWSTPFETWRTAGGSSWMHLCVQIATTAKWRRKPTISNASASSEWVMYSCF
jgi:hypothetical protein